MIIWDSDPSINDTFFRAMLPTRDAFALTVAKLITLSGQKNPGANSDGEKVSVEFVGTFKGEVFTLYDYKEDDEIHIGGREALDIDGLIAELSGALRDALPTPFTAKKHYDECNTYGWPRELVAAKHGTVIAAPVYVYVLFHETNTGHSDDSDGYVEAVYATEEAAKAAEAKARAEATAEGWSVWGDDDPPADGHWDHDWRVDTHQILS